MDAWRSGAGRPEQALPTIIWNAGIMRSKPATIERPGAIATKASRSMMIPKERLCRLCINQPNVKRSAGISSCSRCNRMEVTTSGAVLLGGLNIERNS